MRAENTNLLLAVIRESLEALMRHPNASALERLKCITVALAAVVTIQEQAANQVEQEARR